MGVYVNSILAVVTPDKTWYISRTYENAVEDNEPLQQEEALERLRSLGIDAVIPHMFCMEGMTTYRALMESEGYRLMGNNSEVCAIASHKEKTKEVMRKAGVRVPRGEFMTRRE